jgi:hypothetical protein
MRVTKIKRDCVKVNNCSIIYKGMGGLGIRVMIYRGAVDQFGE